MPPLQPHTDFIVAAYVIASVVIVSMIGTILFDYRALRRALKRFDARDTDRR